ncbi:MAG: Mov34/MPN/PAD-1 family protein [Candidatus Scalindua rubra]|uniref:Mov34/MPN/PAD-1 family protein n=1 Tax=Candidatus Scalindua rubra TaxID=1872076 RepID=A0A1E3X7V6_9BACT|nr:MAG: Mov34/MPN/PAD-1 family protein [Candidatus Scalindua rubra]
MEVFLEEKAFTNIIMSAAEVFKHECYGCLLGYKLDSSIIVETAIPFQTAERSFSAAELKRKQRAVIEKVLKTFPKLKAVGEYHSHPQRGDIKGSVTLSDSDIENIKMEDLEIVIAINDKQRSRQWKYNEDMTLSGSFSDYYFRMAAYYYNGYTNHEPLRTMLWCPSATGLRYKKGK